MTQRRGFLVLSFLIALGLIGTGITIFVLWSIKLNTTIKDRLSGKKWAAPTEFYSAPEKFLKGQLQARETLSSTFDRLEYHFVIEDRPLNPGEFTQWNADLCRQKLTGVSIPDELTNCWTVRIHPRPDQSNSGPTLETIAVDGSDRIAQVYEGEPPKAVNVIELEPELFAQFYGGKPVMRHIVTLGEVPPQLLNAIIAIEDSQFLSHHGVSWTGMLRAAYRNLMHGHVTEGGSTLTQQLVKNYFLTSERTFKRKITEIVMALLLESQFSKDDILETYINEVYLGQQGPFEIHGVAAAATYIYGQALDELSLADCALMAGSIQAPNLYNFIKSPRRALTRRGMVLKRMLELKLISAVEYNQAMSAPLPQPRPRLLKDLAPYFVDAVKLQLNELGFRDLSGIQVYTTMDRRAQAAATQAVEDGLAEVEKNYKWIPKKEKKLGELLEAGLIAGDPTNGFVEAVVGGRSYGQTQLNRVIQSKRQVGSIFKPFVFLTAFASLDENGKAYTPISTVDDEQFTVTYGRQSWSPQNYDDEYEGTVPLYKALQDSLNAATSKVELQVGIDNVIDNAHKAGIDSNLPSVPSLALGSADLTPLEVLQAYSTLAHQGVKNKLTFIYKLKSTSGSVLYQYEPSQTAVLDPVNVAQTVSMMEGVLDRGTGQSIRARGFAHPAAGKTGTTSDTHDAWFGGFTPLHAAVVWVGFDKPEATGLTGALGAIPVWFRYMKNVADLAPPVEFPTPDGAIDVKIDPDSNAVAKPSCPKTIDLIFRKGNEPTDLCPLHP